MSTNRPPTGGGTWSPRLAARWSNRGDSVTVLGTHLREWQGETVDEGVAIVRLPRRDSEKRLRGQRRADAASSGSNPREATDRRAGRIGSKQCRGDFRRSWASGALRRAFGGFENARLFSTVCTPAE